MPTRSDKRELRATVTPEFLSCDEAEILSSVSRWTWRKMAYDGRIESVKIGSRLLLPIREIQRVLREGARKRKDGLPAGVPSEKPRQGDYRVTNADSSVSARA